MISLAAVAGVAYYSRRANSQTDSLDNTRYEPRLGELGRRSRADKAEARTNVDRVYQNISGLVLPPGGPAPNFDVRAGPLSAPDRIILALYNWCQEAPWAQISSWSLVRHGRSPSKTGAPLLAARPRLGNGCSR